MTVYRVAKEKYARDLSGRGAQRFGGRWNSKGVPALYASQHRSLCILELLVHTSLETAPAGMVLLTIQLPDNTPVTTLTYSDLPDSWSRFPFDDFTRQVGDEVLHNGSFLALKVPSAIVSEEYNYVINPQHPDANNLQLTNLTPLNLDHRFFESTSSNP